MDELINEQISIIQGEMDLITNPYERALVRAHFLTALGNLSQIGEFEVATGKDAIRNDNVKPIHFEEEPTEVELEEGTPVTLEETKETKGTKKKKKSKKDDSNEPNEIELEDTQMTVEVEAEDGSMVEIDITEEFALTADYVGDIGETKEAILEARKELATQIATFALTPVFASLENITASNDKLMLAYYMQEYGIEEINAFIQELTDGNYNDVYEFATNDTIGALVADLNKAAEENEEE